MRNSSPSTTAQTGQRAHAYRKSSSVSASGEPPAKKFACGFEGCGRAFTRSEHLQRHLLNHTAGESTCERCRAHFKRKDLLERHMQRHRQKDDEAGREGAGILNTRKRMWKDEDGNIVTKRPNLGKSSQPASPTSDQHQRSRSISTTASVEDVVHALCAEAPISPPISSTHSSQSDSHGRRSLDACDAAADPAIETWVFPPLELSPGPELHTYPDPDPLTQEPDRFWSNADGPPASSLRGLCDDVPYDDIFNPDTASSFNMPFTTMSNYNWLFDVDLAATAAHQQFETSAPDILSGTFSATHVDQAAPDSRSSTHTFATGVPAEHTPTVSDLVTLTADGSSMTAASTTLSQTQSHTSMMPGMSITDSSSMTLPSLEQQHSIFADGQNSVASATIGRSRIMHTSAPQNISIEDESRAARDSLVAHQAQLGIDFECPMSSMNRSASLPIIDEVARVQVLDVIEAAKPVTPDGLYISRNHPLLSLSSLQTYCDLFFTRFNTAYPLVHQPTFDASHAETLLLVSVLLLGATYCEKDAHQMAVCIHDVLRPQIFANAGFSAKPELWVLQTILLVECFGKSRAGQKQHDMAHLFHGLLINLIRRSDCQTVRTSFTGDGSGDLDNDWRTWAESEQKKRLAYLCFMWDVQHAVLFCQSLCMSAFELRSNLPCDQQLWEADSAELWQQLRGRQKNPRFFLSLVKAYLTPGAPPRPRNLNALSRILLLHGLMSISWDMKRRDQTSLGLIDKDPIIGDWKTRMATSYDTWKADFDTYCTNYLSLFCSPGSHDSSSNNTSQVLRQEFLTFTTANNAIYHAAHILLNAEFLDLQIYAGARHILGRPVSRTDHVRSQRVVKRWAAGGGGGGGGTIAPSTAAVHAARLIGDGVGQGFDAPGVFHYPWCLYLATLTCWAWWHARPKGGGKEGEEWEGRQRRDAIDDEDEGHDDVPSDDDVDEDEDEMVWDAGRELDALVACMTAGTSSTKQPRAEERLEATAKAMRPAVVRRRIGGLTAVVARQLGKVRWAVVHDGMMVLRGLVPWRMIGGPVEGVGGMV